MLDPTELTFFWTTPRQIRYQDELELRFRVLREPLGMTREQVTFPFEDESLHLLAVQNHQVVGCVLFHPQGPHSGRLFQMAVEPALQGQGLGAALVHHLEDELRRRGVHEIHLHAREVACGFYSKLGYSVRGAPFTEVGIEHYEMVKQIS